jgi:polyhydroxyalkanoate synthesis regulator phasin
MGCTKHPQRKRADCLECYPPRLVMPVVEKVEEVKQPTKKGKISKEMAEAATKKMIDESHRAAEKKLEEKYEAKISKVVYKPSVTITSSEDIDREIRIEVSRVREYVDHIFAQALDKVRQEVNQIKQIRWEHASIPLTVFNIELMTAVQTDGWKLIDMMRNAKQYGYPDQPDYAVLQRVVKPDNEPLPDMSKPGAVRKYLEKKNGIKQTIKC